MSQELQTWLADQTTTVLLIFGFAFVYVKFILPRQQAAEAARESLLQNILNDTLEEFRRRVSEALEREQRMRTTHEHQMAAMEQRHSEDRKADREMHRDTLKEVSAAIRDNTNATRQSSILVFALGEHLGVKKRDLAESASTLTGEPIDPSVYETKGDK